MSAVSLGVAAVREAVARSGLPPEDVDAVIRALKATIAKLTLPP